MGDIGDHVSTTEPDPTPGEITDPTHPDYVEPYPAATPVLEFDPWGEARDLATSIGYEVRFDPAGES